MRKKGARIKFKAKTSIVFAVSRSDSTELQTYPHAALDRCLLGIADGDDIATLVTRINWAQALAMVTGKEKDPLLDAAVGALVSVIARFERTGQAGVSGDEKRTIGDALNLADQMQVTSTRRELRDALIVAMRSGK